MKKILYLSDYLFDEYNSVRDIVYNTVLAMQPMGFEQVVVWRDGTSLYPTAVEDKHGYKTYFVQKQTEKQIWTDKQVGFFQKVGLSIRWLCHKRARLRRRIF